MSSNTDSSYLNLLLVEDNKGDVYLFREMLKGLEFKCNLQVMDDGASAMKYLESVDQGQAPRPDLIVLDLNLPKVEGAQVLQRFKKIEQCRKTPAVVFTSSSSAQDRAEAHRLGADAYFEKPLHLEDYLRVGKSIVAMCLRGRVEL